MSAYLFVHQGRAYSPGGLTPWSGDAAEVRNREIERAELEAFRSHPDRIVAYVRQRDARAEVTTWLGTAISSSCQLGRRCRIGFGGAERQAVTCAIFGARYVGWYYVSSGDYCRLRKARPRP